LEQSYYERLKFIHQAQHPDENIWVVGEVISMKQGWVEGIIPELPI